MPLLRKPELKPVWSTADGTTVKLYNGDVVDVLRKLPAASVHCVVTSPPYWGLRDYQTGEWVGGDAECDHSQLRGGVGAASAKQVSSPGASTTYQYKETCGKCGAKRIDNQIGSEPSPDCGAALGKLPAQFILKVVTEVLKGAEEYRPEFQAKIIADLLVSAQVKREPCGRCFVCKMVEVFREVRRVLRDDGTLWLNLGDSYGQNNGKGFDTNQDGGDRKTLAAGQTARSSLPSGNLVGIPWRVALALQADGWILRQDIIWSKPSPMPESVKNRCTKSHEYIFLLVKRMGYYYDAEAIKEPLQADPESYKRMLESKQRQKSAQLGTSVEAGAGRKTDGFNSFISDGKTEVYIPNGSNKRSVWRVSSQGYEGAHFATFPEKLIEPCILAGTSERGCCVKCGAPWRRVVNAEGYSKADTSRKRGNAKAEGAGGEHDQGEDINRTGGGHWITKTIGWEPTCTCGMLETEPCVVCDPFCGSGTTNCVALAHGQRSIGIDLSLDYIRANAIPRIEGELIKRGAANLSGRPIKRVDVGEPA